MSSIRSLVHEAMQLPVTERMLWGHPRSTCVVLMFSSCATCVGLLIGTIGIWSSLLCMPHDQKLWMMNVQVKSKFLHEGEIQHLNE
jgi:uncharacterized membrane protein SpoIIM required for sporulation